MCTKRPATNAGSVPSKPSISPRLVQFGSAGVDLTSWRLPSLAGYDEEFSRKVLAAASEAVSLSVEQGVVAFLMTDAPAREGSRQQLDPTLIYLELSLGVNDLENPVWAFSLSDTIQSALMALSRDDALLPEEKSRRLRRMRDSMHELVLRIDDVLRTSYDAA